MEECPKFMDRETEVFSAYFTKLIHEFIANNITIDKLMICLSGQHEMVTDFSGFRNFFTLNFIAKPIYNAYLLSSKLYTNILKAEKDNDNLFVIPTADDNGDLSVMLTYCSEFFKDDIEDREEKLILPSDVIGKKIAVWCIDKETTNPYRLCVKNGYDQQNLSEEELKTLRNEGLIKPVKEFVANTNEITLKLTANCTYLITV